MHIDSSTTYRFLVAVAWVFLEVEDGELDYMQDDGIWGNSCVNIRYTPGASMT